LHPGDISHHFYAGNQLYDPAELSAIWEDRNGVAAWILCAPGFAGFDAQVRPDLRGDTFESEVLEIAESQTAKLMARYDKGSSQIEATACQCDTDRSRLLTRLGWTCHTEALYALNHRRLEEIPEPEFPEGYHIRPVRGVQEAGVVAEAHVAVFTGAKWTTETYRRYMESPGYSVDREFVVEADDGTLAAFTVTWHDELNGTGLFEPVGTHPDHRGKGIARAMIYWAMRGMAEAGLSTALVQNKSGNTASRSLYRACGFEPWQLEDGYSKAI